MRRSIAGAALVLVSGLLLVAPGAAQASGTLDQEQTSIVTAYGVQGSPQPTSLAQTFTAGLTGGLTEVDLALCIGSGVTATLDVEITTVSAGAPTSTVLASAVVPPASVTANCASSSGVFVPIGFTSPASVTAGTQYAIVAYTADPNGYGWGGTTGGGYAAGSAWSAISSPPTTWEPLSPAELAFKTYVSALPAATSLTAAPQVDLHAPRSAVGLGVASATLTSGGAGLSGQKITFTDGSLQLCTAITNPNGVATCQIPLKDEIWVLLNNHYTATYTATSGYTGSTATTPAVIL